MSIQILELEDQRFIGCGVCEITAVPLAETIHTDITQALSVNADTFMRLINELGRFCTPNVSVIEILLISEPAVNQVYKAQIRMFAVFREMGESPSLIKERIAVMQDNCIAQLSALSYIIQAIDVSGAEFTKLLDGIYCDNVEALVKSEKCMVNANTPFPYYYCDLLNGKSINNFRSILEAFTRYEGAVLSFQLLPTAFTVQEGYMINEMTAALGKVVSGFPAAQGQLYRDPMAQTPFDYYNYYTQNIRQPLFTYNILVFGNRLSCPDLSGKLLSFLQGAGESGAAVEFETVDLCNEQIDLKNDFVFYPWNVNSRLIYNYRNQYLWQNMSISEDLLRMPYLITAQEASSFFRLPIDDKNIIGVKVNINPKVKEQFASSVIAENNIQMGNLIGATDIIIGCPQKAFTKHALIVGTPGSGKTTFSVNILLQFAKKSIPFLAIEPTKTEYRAMIDAVPDLQIFTPGNNAVSPFIINPFIPPKDIRIEQYIPSLANAFKAAFSMPSPLDAIFLKAIRSCYTEYGWKDYSKFGDADVTNFGLYEFIIVFKKLIADTSYSREVKGNLESGGLLRLMNLIEQNSNIYDTIHTVPLEDILSKPTVLELNAIDNLEQKALIMALLLINICIYTKHNQIGDGELKNVILIDEAHVLLGASPSSSGDGADSQATTVKALQNMIAEIRSYGTSIVIADQSPTKVSREVVANTDIKVSFRLVQSIEKELIADSTGMDERAKQQLSSLKVGEAYVYYNQLDTPQLLITEDIREKEGIRLSVPNDEVVRRSTYWQERGKLLKPYIECGLCRSCDLGCDFRLRSDAGYLAGKLFQTCNKSINDSETLKKYAVSIPKLLESTLQSYDDIQREKIVNCIKIKFLRKAQLETSFALSKREITQVVTQKGS